jgi:hypothetical protein
MPALMHLHICCLASCCLLLPSLLFWTWRIESSWFIPLCGKYQAQQYCKNIATFQYRSMHVKLKILMQTNTNVWLHGKNFWAIKVFHALDIANPPRI